MLEQYGYEFMDPLAWWLEIGPVAQAAWVQAIGTLVALKIAILLPWAISRGERRRQRQRDESARRIAIAQLAPLIHATASQVELLWPRDMIGDRAKVVELAEPPQKWLLADVAKMEALLPLCEKLDAESAGVIAGFITSAVSYNAAVVHHFNETRYGIVAWAVKQHSGELVRLAPEVRSAVSLD
jgi:hypothetical protein